MTSPSFSIFVFLSYALKYFFNLSLQATMLCLNNNHPFLLISSWIEHLGNNANSENILHWKWLLPCSYFFNQMVILNKLRWTSVIPDLNYLFSSFWDFLDELVLLEAEVQLLKHRGSRPQSGRRQSGLISQGLPIETGRLPVSCWSPRRKCSFSKVTSHLLTLRHGKDTMAYHGLLEVHIIKPTWGNPMTVPLLPPWDPCLSDLSFFQ